MRARGLGTCGSNLESLLHQFFNSNRTSCSLAFHHLFDILRDQVCFKIQRIPRLEAAEIGHFNRMRKDRDLASEDGALPLEFGNGKTDTLNRDRSLEHRVLLNLWWDFNV